MHLLASLQKEGTESVRLASRRAGRPRGSRSPCRWRSRRGNRLLLEPPRKVNTCPYHHRPLARCVSHHIPRREQARGLGSCRRRRSLDAKPCSPSRRRAGQFVARGGRRSRRRRSVPDGWNREEGGAPATRASSASAVSSSTCSTVERGGPARTRGPKRERGRIRAPRAHRVLGRLPRASRRSRCRRSATGGSPGRPERAGSGGERDDGETPGDEAARRSTSGRRRRSLRARRGRASCDRAIPVRHAASRRVLGARPGDAVQDAHDGERLRAAELDAVLA